MGTIALGYYADLAILFGDPVADASGIKTVRVQATIINGETACVSNR